MSTQTFRRYEFPPGMTAATFAYVIEELDYANVTDSLYTDELSEVLRIVPELLKQGYNVRVIHGDQIVGRP